MKQMPWDLVGNTVMLLDCFQGALVSEVTQETSPAGTYKCLNPQRLGQCRNMFSGQELESERNLLPLPPSGKLILSSPGTYLMEHGYL